MEKIFFNAFALACYGKQAIQHKVMERLSEFMHNEAICYRLFIPEDNSPDSQSYLFKLITTTLIYDVTMQGTVQTLLPYTCIDP
jgi:hypothetical protein